MLKRQNIKPVKLSELTKKQYSSGDVAKFLGVTNQTIIQYDIKGMMDFDRTMSGRRTMSREKLIQLLNQYNALEDDTESLKRDVAIMLNCNEKSYLHENMLLAYVAQQSPHNLLVIRCDKVKDRNNIEGLVGMIESNKVSRIFAKSIDKQLITANYIDIMANYHKVCIDYVDTQTMLNNANISVNLK